jgi:opacity protein-like surface antigen
MHPNRGLLASGLLLLTTGATAQDFYLGAHIGTAVIEDSPLRVIGELDTEPNWRLLAGWQFHEQWAIEGSYHDFGEADGSFRPCDQPCTPDIPVQRKVASEAWSVRLAWRAGAERWQPFLAVGWTWLDSEGLVRGLGSGVGVRYGETDSGFSAEAGVRFQYTERFALRAGYEYFDLAAAGSGAFNLGAEWRF